MAETKEYAWFFFQRKQKFWGESKKKSHETILHKKYYYHKTQKYTNYYDIHDMPFSHTKKLVGSPDFKVYRLIF